MIIFKYILFAIVILSTSFGQSFGKNKVQVHTARSTRSMGPDAKTPERPNTQRPIKDDDVIDI